MSNEPQEAHKAEEAPRQLVTENYLDSAIHGFIEQAKTGSAFDAAQFTQAAQNLVVMKLQLYEQHPWPAGWHSQSESFISDEPGKV